MDSSFLFVDVLVLPLHLLPAHTEEESNDRSFRGREMDPMSDVLTTCRIVDSSVVSIAIAEGSDWSEDRGD